MCRMLARTMDLPVAGSCAIMPIPSLLALPSQPRDMRAPAGTLSIGFVIVIRFSVVLVLRSDV